MDIRTVNSGGSSNRIKRILTLLPHLLIVNDKKFPWYYTLGMLVVIVYYGWLFSPIPMYYVVGVPKLEELKAVRGQFKIIGNQNINSGPGVPQYFVLAPEGRTRIHCGPLPHPVNCSFFDLYLNKQAVSTFWYDPYFGVLQVQIGNQPEFKYATSVRGYIKNELGQDGKLAAIVFPFLLIVYGMQIRRVYLMRIRENPH